MAAGVPPASSDGFLTRPSRGFVLGKFMPPHAGHEYLCAFGETYVDQLTILVCSLPDDPIPGELRHQWMQELFPRCRVLHCAELLPQAPEDDPDNFWPIWRDVVRRYHPEPLDVVFASEPYGHRLAAETGARFVPVDPGRTVYPVSGTAVRKDPYANWQYLTAPARPFFLKRVTLIGAESTGKTTLANALAAHFDTLVAPEFGRFHTEVFGQSTTSHEDMRHIVQGHLAGRRALERKANRVLVEDTDPVLTAIWSDTLAGGRHPWFDAFDDYPDLYLVCGADIPWVNDGTRYFAEPERRLTFQTACVAELERRNVPWLLLSGSVEARMEQAVAAIDALLRP
jgi:HTH-type transcriptional repressor of NAD biosynthesis genes